MDLAKKMIPNDALGGGGSIRSDLRAIATGGLSRAIDGFFARKYPLTSFNSGAAVNTSGELRPAAAPGAPPTGAGSSLAGLFSNPIAVAIGVAAAIAVLVVFIVRK